MIEDELFKGKDNEIVDECLAILATATQTTTILTTNALYYLSKYTEKRERL
jgi:cytochrome P450